MRVTVPQTWFDRAAKAQREADRVGLGRKSRQPTPASRQRDHLQILDETVIDERIRAASRKLFVDRHYARAVEEAFKCLNNEVKKKTGLTSRDGASLMRHAFSEKTPVLKITAMESESERNEHNGYRDIFAGSMTGIRNPRAHEHELADRPEIALELLVLANHLICKIDNATESK